MRLSIYAAIVLMACGRGSLPLDKAEGSSADKVRSIAIQSSGSEVTVGGSPIRLAAIIEGGRARQVVTWTLFGPGTLSATDSGDADYSPPDSIDVDATITVTASADGMAAHAIIGVHPPPVLRIGGEPVALAFADGGLWVADESSGAVLEIRPSDGAILHSIQVGGYVYALLSDGNTLWVSNDANHGTARLRLADGAALGRVNSLGILAFDGDSIWMASDTILRMNPADASILGSFPYPAGYGGAYLHSIVFDGTSLWVIGWSQVISKLRPSDGEILQNVSIGGKPQNLQVGQGTIWVSTYSPRPSVVAIDTTTGAVLGSADFADPISSLLFDGTDLWVATGRSLGPSPVVPDARVFRLRTRDLTPMSSAVVAGVVTDMAFDGKHVWVSSLGGGGVLTRL